MISKIKSKIKKTQSNILRKRGKTGIKTKDFLDSEKILQKSLNLSMKEINEWLKEKNYGGELDYDKTKKCVTVYKNLNLNYKNKDNKGYSSPDGGYIYWRINGKKHLILITEDKKQGTNDKRMAEGLKRQSLGNAIERFAKNSNFNSLLVHEEDIYPYILFGSGCDFHESETIAGRLKQGNFGKDNIREVTTKFSIYKERGYPTINIFLKSHKWNEGEYGCSDWTLNERIKICVEAMKQSIEYYYNKYHSENSINFEKNKILLQIEELQNKLKKLE